MKAAGLGLYIMMVVISAAGAQNTFRLDSTIRFDYINGDSVPSLKNIFFYNEFDQLVEEIDQNWSLIHGIWENYARVRIHYSNDKQDTITNWEYIVDSWIPTNRIINHYEGDLLEEIIAQNWKKTSNLWTNNSITIHGTEGDNSYVIHMQWDSAEMSWHPVDSVLTIRESSGQAQNDTTYSWLDLANTFIYTGLTKYRYDSAGQLITRSRYNYDLDDLVFRPRSRDTFAYNEDGFQILSQFDAWLEPLYSWEPSFRVERMSNSDGNLAQSILFFYDFISQQLRPTSRLEYTYTDGTARAASDSLIYSVENFVYQGPFEIPDYLRRYYYSQQSTTAVQQYAVEPVSVYPNPAMDEVFINGSSSYSHYRWLDISGRVLANGVIQNNERIPLPRNGQGTLILQLISPHLKSILTIPVLSY